MAGLDMLRLMGGNQGTTSQGFATRGFSDTAGASFRATMDNFNLDSEYNLKTQPREERDTAYQSRTGVKIKRVSRNDMITPGQDWKLGQVQDDHLMGGKYVNLPAYMDVHSYAQDATLEDSFFQSQKSQNAALADLKLNSDIDQGAREKAQTSMRQLEETAARNTSDFSRISGSIVGGLGASVLDPLTLATLPIGAGELKVVGTGAAAYARALTLQAGKEGLLQAGISTLAIPQIANWQKEVGHQYGLAEAATDVGFAFAGGAAFRAGSEVLGPAIRGTARGANKLSSYVLNEIAWKTPNLPPNVRDALMYNSRVAHIEENAPMPIKSRKELKEHKEAIQRVADNIDTYKKPAANLPGVTRITTPRGQLDIEVKARLVELDDLITSDRTEFDPALQPRQRAERASSDARINEIAARLDPAQLGESRVSNTGSPIVGPDMMVESGNGRVMALRRVYEANPENAKAYRDFLESQGYDTKGMKNPVLVRQRLSEFTPEERKKFVTFSNEDVVDRLSTTERAMADAKLLDDTVLDMVKSSNLEAVGNAPFIRTFLDQAVSPSERNAFVNPSGELSQDGLRRVRAALLAKAYDNADLVQKLLEDTDTNIKTIGDVLMDNAAAWARLRSKAKNGLTIETLDITAYLVDAVRSIVSARNDGKSMADVVLQVGLFAENDLDGMTIALIRGMYSPDLTRALGKDKVQSFVDFYLTEADKVQIGIDLAGERPLEPIEIVIAALEKQHGKETVKGFGLKKEQIKNHVKEVAAIRAAGLDEIAKQTKHPRKGITFLQAIDEIGARPTTEKIMNAPDREAVHDKIIKELTTEPEGGFKRDKIIEIVMGPPGAGKSKVLVDRVNSDLKGMIVDSDMVKERLPEFDDGLGANAVHEESKQIADVLLEYAAQNGFNIIHPIVGSAPEKVAKLIERFAAKGYSVNLRLVQIPSKISLGRVLRRFNEEGRAIPPTYVMGIGDGPVNSFNLLKTRDDINAYSYFDNDVAFGTAPKIIESNDPRFIAAEQQIREAGNGQGTGSGLRSGETFGEEIGSAARINEAFDANAYRLSEYRQQPAKLPDEVSPTPRFEISKARFKELTDQNPDMMIDLEDGSRLTLADYAKRLETDERMLSALTTCMVA